MEVKFNCPSCQINNILKIDSNSGCLLDDLYLQKKLITKDEILNKHIAKENPKIYKHLGELMIFQNLSALYVFSICDNCGAKFIIAFSFGESQPSRDICYISGVWLINEISKV